MIPLIPELFACIKNVLLVKTNKATMALKFMLQNTLAYVKYILIEDDHFKNLLSFDC